MWLNFTRCDLTDLVWLFSLERCLTWLIELSWKNKLISGYYFSLIQHAMNIGSAFNLISSQINSYSYKGN